MEVTRKRARRAKPRSMAPIMSQLELQRLGDGQVAYIRMLTTSQAKAMFPAVDGLPKGVELFALHAADGTPIALTDSRQAAIGHARDGELEVASVH